ncbi:hypothetical protein [Flavobacterium sp.]|uniref:hypothetical protein n=1 Tax=Flavobacterium sp. TaxID=239 RepID=UPI001209051E|nr:hypothetical protein [Flavobacterium sp.]RZJ71479.1 MAG: hypothetical protein EOO49_10495 [Flavobacterium sp.]
MKSLIQIFLIMFSLANYAQETNSNSNTRKFIDNAEFIQVNRDWSVKAQLTSGIGEVVSFFPIEATNLKSNLKIKALQMDMTVNEGNKPYFKSSWIDLNEIDEFITFLDSYVVPNLNDKTEKKQSTTYIFNTKEIRFSFHIGQNSKRISIFLKDNGSIDNSHYFWTESQNNKIPDLLTILKQIR